MPPDPRLAALLSGEGTTLQNLLDRGAAGRFPRIELALSHRPSAGGLARATRAGVPTAVVPKGEGGPEFSARVFAELRSRRIDWVVLAGWLQLLHIPDDFHQRVVNVHPSLLPAFGGAGMYGLRVHRAAYEAGCRVGGCTVHFADATYDTGPIVAQAAVSLEECASPEEVMAKVQELEREVYPAAILRLLNEPWRVEGRRLVWG